MRATPKNIWNGSLMPEQRSIIITDFAIIEAGVHLPRWFMELFCERDENRQVWVVSPEKLDRS